MIKPSIGRVVWYYEDTIQHEPFAALIVKVIDDRHVNVAGFDHCGVVFSHRNVQLLQDDDKMLKSDCAYVMWIPYQIGQAAKTEALEKKIASMA